MLHARGCWVKTFVRGLGKRPSTCPKGDEFGGNRCYTKCKSGYTGWGTTCYQDCPAEAKQNSTGFCKRPKSFGRLSSQTPIPGFEKIGLRYFSPCKPGYTETATQCIGKCPEGTTDGGWFGCRK